jgi:RHS repeat-associated protein
MTTRSFYDGWGRLVETRTPAPGNQDVVRYLYYDASGRLAIQSIAYFVATYSGSAGAAAFSLPDSLQPYTTNTYDGLGRLLTSKDPLSNQTTTAISVACNAAGTGDAACYEQTQTVDPLGHQQDVMVDAFARQVYAQRFTGNAPANYAVYATTKYRYDRAGNLTSIAHPDGTSSTSFVYDMGGRTTQQTDPDTGVTTYGYDQDGILTQSIDARSATGTVFAGYDGIDRPLWRNSTNNPNGAFATFSYDSTASGNQGIGRLTGETFSGGPNYALSGSYAHTYDARGRETSRTLTAAGQPYQLQSTFDDAGNILSQTYPTGELVTTGYSTQGWVTGLNASQGNTTLLSNGTYSQGANQFGGPTGLMTGASIAGGTYQYSATYDALLRATDIKLTNGSGSTTFFDQSRTFDAASNVTTANTTLPAGSDNQAFCYEEQNRLIWAGAAGTPPCGVSLTPGTLTAAQYTHALAYDNLGRLTSGPAGSYTYGNTAHLHAATAIGTTWTAAYDAAGNMSCRAPSANVTCTGTPTGASLSFDAQGQLSAWQNAPSSPTSTDGFLYDNQGNRVEQQSAQAGTTTTTVYVGNLEQVAISGSTTTTTTYYYAKGQRIALAVNGVFSYLASDALGSAAVVLNASGSVTASLLYAPYGGTRYSNSIMPTDYGFTGQRADATTGLDYYNARYYDPAAGQFASADTILSSGGKDILSLSRYAYVEGNPIGRIDPSGNVIQCAETCGGPVESTLGSGSNPSPEFLLPPEDSHLTVPPSSSSGHALAPSQTTPCMYGDAPGSCNAQLAYDLGYYSSLGPAQWACSANPACVQATGDVASYAALFIPGPDALALSARIAKGLLRVREASDSATFVADSSGVTRIFVKAGSETLEINPHAALRMAQRGISIDSVVTTLSKPGFAYFHKGVWKVGFYDPASRIFVGTADGEVKTVIANPNANYIANLLDNTW